MTHYQDAVRAVRTGTTVDDAAAAVVANLTDDEKLWCLDGDEPTWAGLGFLTKGGYHRAPFDAARLDRVGLPGIAFSDGPRGVVIGNATAFPVSMARGATWDPELEEQIGEVVGAELRASGATLFGGVCVNVLRHPAWGRAQETYGEDPHHVGEMGAALTRGVQRHAMACVKHFACNSMENARFKIDVSVDEAALHEVYLPHFRRIVDEGVACVMSAYNAVNGDCCGQSEELLTEILRGEWGFEGFVISDWIYGLRDAGRSLAAGLDVEMPYRMVRAEHLVDDIASGIATWADVDHAVTRLVTTLLRFDAVLSQPAADRASIGSAEHLALARVAAARSIVLLRNEVVDGQPVLPIDPTSVHRVAVFGRLAAAVNLGDGGSSDVWALDPVTPLQGLRGAVPTPLEVVDATAATAVDAAAIAATADVAIVVVGYTHADEGEFIGDPGVDLRHLFPPGDDPELVARYEARNAALPPIVTPDHIKARAGDLGFSTGGDRTSLRLADTDVALIRAVAAANRRTVVIVQAGSAVVCTEWDGEVAALVQAFYGGSAAGWGLADVVFGRVNPSARLPFSVPADEAHLPAFDRDADTVTYDRWHGWWHLERAGHRPAYPFGFGLSYTTFDLGDFGLTDDGVEIVVTGSVANTGDRDGATVVQVYATLPDLDAPRRLVGFTRVDVSAGSSTRVTVRIPLPRLAQRDPVAHAWTTRPGTYRLAVAQHATDTAAKQLAVDLPG